MQICCHFISKLVFTLDIIHQVLCVCVCVCVVCVCACMCACVHACVCVCVCVCVSCMQYRTRRINPGHCFNLHSGVTT